MSLVAFDATAGPEYTHTYTHSERTGSKRDSGETCTKVNLKKDVPWPRESCEEEQRAAIWIPLGPWKRSTDTYTYRERGNEQKWHLHRTVSHTSHPLSLSGPTVGTVRSHCPCTCVFQTFRTFSTALVGHHVPHCILLEPWSPTLPSHHVEQSRWKASEIYMLTFSFFLSPHHVHY